MKSKKLRNLVASVALIAMAVTVVPATHANAAGVTTNVDISKDQGFFENNWALNGLEVVDAYDINSNDKLSSTASETKETVLSIEKVETGVLGKKTIVGQNKTAYEADDRQGGFIRLGLRITGNLESYLRSEISNAVSEYRDNVNLINSNQHNGGNSISTARQDILGKKLNDAFLGLDKNKGLELLVTYEQDGKTRTTNVSAKDIRFESPRKASSVENLNSLVDENGLVYLTLRGLPTGINVTNIELDSRTDLYLGTSYDSIKKEFTTYSLQTDLNYNTGSAVIPTATWTLTDSLYSYIRSVDGKQANQFVDDGDNIIEQNEHTFVNVSGSSVTLVDVVKDTDSVITGVTVTDRRGDVFNAEVGNFSVGKYPGEPKSNFSASDVDYRNRYKDIKINGLNNRTTYEFEYMDITYKSGDGERTQRVRFDDSRATGTPGVTGKYLVVATSENRSSEIGGYNTLLNKSNLYQVNVGLDRLTYIVKVDDTTNLERIEVRGLRGGETYEVKNVKSKDGKNSKSSWFAIEITGLEQNRNYDFLSLETVYNDNGRERYGNPVSLGRNASAPYSNVLFPNTRTNENRFTTTNKENRAEAWIDSKLEYEQIPGGVRFVGRVKDADSILNGVTAYINNNGTYEKIDDANVKMEKTYRVVNGVDKSGNIDYDYLVGNEAKLNFNASNVESASEMVEITITGIQADRTRDFRFDFTTSEDGYRVNTIRTDSIGAFGSINAGGIKTQQGITRYATGRAGDTKVQVGTSGVQVSGVTTTTANVTADIKNPDKEGIVVEVSGSGVSGVVAKYNVDKNIIELSGLRVGTEYKDMKLVLKYGTKSTTLDVPTFRTSEGNNAQVQGGVAGYVARVYRAFFNREPEQEGLLYWTQRLVSGQETLKGFLGQVSFTPEMLEKNLTNTQFVEAMYAIVDRAGESEGVAFWVSEIEKGIKAGETQSQARSAVVLRMLDTPEVKDMAKKLGIKFE